MPEPGRALPDSNLASVSLFPIAAVGASAGGLAPTTELLRALGPDPGLGLVVIHHLDPTHDSALVEILARATTMPVAAAADGTKVERNHVYVVPPNAGLLISGGVLQVVPRTEEGGLHLPIDRFCESLALDRDGFSVAVVLSGSGFDGTQGVRAIKRVGGITLAQDGSASFASMPESAVRTGCIDVVAAPPELAGELRRIGASASQLAMSPALEVSGEDYSKILSAMRKASGVDFASYKRSTIQRRVQRRVFLRGLRDLATYAELLQREPAEVATLCEEVLIHVTSFFREPAALEALCALALPKLCEGRSNDSPLRIWVPGCSTGEEVYSIAMCLLEFLEAAHLELPIKLFGTDLSQNIVDRARAGRYPSSIEGEVSQARLQRFFARREAEYQIRRDVRDMCVFAQHDVTRDPPFSSMDLISCRNLLIYLGTELQDRVVALFHYALKEPGFLMLGGAETVRSFPGFAPVDAKHKLYARTSAAPRLLFDFGAPHRWRDSVPEELSSPLGDSAHRSVAPSDVHREADRLVLAEFGPPGIVVTSDLAIVQFRGQTGPFLEPSPGAASLDLLRMAREELRLPLRNALDRARQSHAAVTQDNVTLSVADKQRSLTLRVVPFAVHAPQQRYFLVLFEDSKPSADPKDPSRSQKGADAAPEPEVSLRQELASTRQYLESVIEQLEATNEELKAANEEVVSSNEELRSTNEELQSAKEELQATNEELSTVNDELRGRNVEANRLSDDLTNVLGSAEIPMLIVGRDARLNRFTPAAGKTFGLITADLGRPWSEVPALVGVAPTLSQLLGEVREKIAAAGCTIQDARGVWLELSARPYITLDGRIDGAVVVARDVGAERRAAERLAAARQYAEDVVDTVRDGLLVLNGALCVSTANAAFCRQFRLEPDTTRGKRLSELARSELATPALQQVLTQIQQGASIDNVRVEQSDLDGEKRAYLLNGRRIAGTELMLLAFEDITETEQAREAAARAELVFRGVLTSATEGVLIVNGPGRILFANPAAAAMFGYQGDELTGEGVELLLPVGLRDAHAKDRARYLEAPTPRPMGLLRALAGRRKDGTEVPVEISLSPMAHADGSAVVAFVTDITQRREAEREIQAYQGRLQRMGFDAAVTEQRERRRIAIGLHDQVGQALALAQIKLTSARTHMAEGPRTAVDGAVELIEEAIAAQRSLVFELSPPVLYDLGLEAALAWLAEDVEKRYGVRLEIHDEGGDKPLDDNAKAIVFRAVRELVMNVLKHAGVPTATISLRRSADGVEVDVQDHGVGFDPEALRRVGEGFGLLSVREQVSGLGGSLHVESAAQQGTLVKLRVPLGGSEPDGVSNVAPDVGEGAA